MVVVCAVNTPETIFAIYGLNRLGAIANMVDPRTNEHQLREYMNECESKTVATIALAYPVMKKAVKNGMVENVVIISISDSFPVYKKLLYCIKNDKPHLDSGVLFWKDFILRGKEEKPVYPNYEKGKCSIIAHTGGTTGIPKSVMLSNDNINAVTHGYRYLGIPFERKQRYFNDLPPFIMYGLCLGIHTALVYGQEVILYPVFDSKQFPRQFVKYKPHHFSAVPDHLKNLATDKITKNLDLSYFITAGVGGDSVDYFLEQEINDYLHSHNCKYEVVKGYGMTELAATAVSSFSDANATGSVGIPLVANSIKVMDLDTMKELGYDETGEIWISGPSIMLGYYNNLKATEEIIRTDESGIRWIRTGDLGHISKEGLVFHEGRIRRLEKLILGRWKKMP